MKRMISFTAVVLLLLVVSTGSKLSAKAHPAPTPEHPAYLHALSDLRAARWLIEHRQTDTWKGTEDEIAAVREIDAAINEIRKAGIDDHKDLKDHPKDEVNEHAGRLHKAAEYLHKADADVDEHESDAEVRGLKDRAHQHIREAIRATEAAMRNAH
jgi:hypothetical protein